MRTYAKQLASTLGIEHTVTLEVLEYALSLARDLAP
jgi:hypothetical protein